MYEWIQAGRMDDSLGYIKNYIHQREVEKEDISWATGTPSSNYDQIETNKHINLKWLPHISEFTGKYKQVAEVILKNVVKLDEKECTAIIKDHVHL